MTDEPDQPGRFPPVLRRLVRGHLLMFGVGMVLLGGSQILSPDRWDTDIYHDVYVLAGPRLWGIVFTAAGILKLAAATHWPRLALAALIGGSLIISWWAAAFCVSTVTEPRFPPTAAVVWLWLLGVHLGIANLFDRRWGTTRARRS